MIPWKNPETHLPEAERTIYVFLFNHLKNGALSSEIIGCRVRDIKSQLTDRLVAQNEDHTARGWYSYTLLDRKPANDKWKEGRPLAWCYAEELNSPEWIEHRAQ